MCDGCKLPAEIEADAMAEMDEMQSGIERLIRNSIHRDIKLMLNYNDTVDVNSMSLDAKRLLTDIQITPELFGDIDLMATFAPPNRRERLRRWYRRVHWTIRSYIGHLWEAMQGRCCGCLSEYDRW